MKRAEEYTTNLRSPPVDIKEKLFQEYLINLPDDPLIWIENAPEGMREQFIRFSNRLSKRKSHQDLLNKIVNKSKLKVGRNDPCPCGSGKKYKKCHLDKAIPSQ
jgi:preprotein translocase subunit SecA